MDRLVLLNLLYSLLFDQSYLITLMLLQACRIELMQIKLLYSLILFTMGINGALYMAWFLSPPNPDKIGFWYFIYFLVFPLLGILGVLSLILKKSLNLSWWLGTLLLLYVGILTLLANSFQLGFAWILAWFPQGSIEVFHVVAFAITLLGLLIVMKQR